MTRARLNPQVAAVVRNPVFKLLFGTPAIITAWYLTPYASYLYMENSQGLSRLDGKVDLSFVEETCQINHQISSTMNFVQTRGEHAQSYCVADIVVDFQRLSDVERNYTSEPLPYQFHVNGWQSKSNCESQYPSGYARDRYPQNWEYPLDKHVPCYSPADKSDAGMIAVHETYACGNTACVRLNHLEDMVSEERRVLQENNMFALGGIVLGAALFIGHFGYIAIFGLDSVGPEAFMGITNDDGPDESSPLKPGPDQGQMSVPVAYAQPQVPVMYAQPMPGANMPVPVVQATVMGPVS